MHERSVDKSLVRCKLCDEESTVSGLRVHLRFRHPGYNTERYVKEFGEFRPKRVKENKLKDSSTINCKECGESLTTLKHLKHHVKKHKLSWKRYYIKYFNDGKIPTCKCGCGEDVKFLTLWDKESNAYSHYRDYKSGHNPNGMTGKEHRLESKLLMRERAIDRMKEGNTVFHSNGPSEVELELRSYIKELLPDQKMVFEDKKVLSGQELDIYIPDMKLAFEFNGSYFHSDTFKSRMYHLKKTEQCAELGIRLIHVHETDWRKNKDIQKSIIKSIVGKIDRRVFARKSVIKKYTFREASSFYEKNHIQGYAPSSIHLGLEFNSELLCMMSFSKGRRFLKNKDSLSQFELLRYCNKVDTQVVGGASRLFSHFLRLYKPSFIYSYANRDWSKGGMYEKLGFIFEKYTDPGYFYVKNGKRRSRYSSQKHILKEEFPDLKDLSEYQIMSRNNYYRIWNCGNLVFHWEE